MSDPLSDRTTHLLVRTSATFSGDIVPTHTACGRRLADCHYYVSSMRYVDCDECVRYYRRETQLDADIAAAEENV